MQNSIAGLKGPLVTRRHALRGIVGAAAAMGSLGATPGQAWADTPVAILVWEGYENPAAFKGLSGISLRAAFLAANEDTITKTASPGAFDLLTIYQGMIDPLRKVHRIEPIDISKLPNYADLFPLFRNAPAFTRDGQHYGIPYTWGTMMTLYDSEQLPEPKSFSDLTHPRLKGKIGVPDDAYAVITTFARYAGIKDANSLSKERLGQVMDLLRKFKSQILSITPSYGELPAMYQRGEILASVPDWTPTLIGANKAGRKIKSTVLAEGGFSFVDSWMRVVGAQQPEEAYRVINHAISVDAQKVIAVSTGLGIVNQKAVADLDSAVAEPWSYDQVDRIFVRAPLYSGAPIETTSGLTTYQDWVAAWTDFKAA